MRALKITALLLLAAFLGGCTQARQVESIAFAIILGADLTEEEEGQVILKEIKQLKETIDMTPEDRTDLIEEAQKRLAVLEEYAPKMMSEDEIKAVITSVLADLGIDAPTAKDKGKIMKELMPKVKGKADGKEVNQILAGMMK